LEGTPTKEERKKGKKPSFYTGGETKKERGTLTGQGINERAQPKMRKKRKTGEERVKVIQRSRDGCMASGRKRKKKNSLND